MDSQTNSLEEDLNVDYSDFETILKKAGCQDFQSHVWSYIYRIVSIENGAPPPYHTVRERIIQRIKELMKDHSASKEDIRRFATRFVEIYALVTDFMDQRQSESATETLVQFEYGVVEENNEEFINELTETFLELDKNAKALNQECQKEESLTYIAQDTDTPLTASEKTDVPSDSKGEWDIEWFYKMKRNTHPLVYGARKVMSTAYQSCSVLDLPLMSSGHSITGIQRVSMHSSGNGWRRVVTNLNALGHSHYYLRGASIPNYPQCLNVRHYPLIYDYGGKPATSLHSINLFTNSGSGSKALGVDCSGFVTTAMASAGLRLKHKVFIRPIHVKGINSWMFKNARRNKLSCLQQQDILPTNPIQSGDIIASNSHVFIVEFSGADPLNLKRFRNSNECHSSKIKREDLNFTVIQSSAHNNGVGINRMHIRDAIDGLSTLTRGLKKTASRACYQMFGIKAHDNINEISILRHASDVSACRDREIYLKNQECLKSCEPQYL
ncbi:MAG: hypothetical protein OXM55_06365 [Bdellovibrionales bacterium]|nr:hypothetical protein [Bdellovibrionales bacterium]